MLRLTPELENTTNDLVADGYAIQLDGVSTLGDDMKNQH